MPDDMVLDEDIGFEEDGGLDKVLERYAEVFTGNEIWNAIPVSGGDLYEWDPESTYIQEPPFFMDLSPDPQPISEIKSARVLALLGDSVGATTWLSTDRAHPLLVLSKSTT